MKALWLGNGLGAALLIALLWDLIVALPGSNVPFLATGLTGIFFLGVFFVLTVLLALIRRSVPLFNLLFAHFLGYAVVFWGLLNLLYHTKHLVDR